MIGGASHPTKGTAARVYDHETKLRLRAGDPPPVSSDVHRLAGDRLEFVLGRLKAPPTR